MTELKIDYLEINYKNKIYRISYLKRMIESSSTTLLYLHGLGSSKTDFIETAHIGEFDKFNLVAFDQPGCGNSNYFNDVALTISDLKEITFMIIEKLSLRNIVIIGHSFGGLTALLSAAHKEIVGFISVEGNLSPEDCFISRYIAEAKTNKDEKKLFDDFKNKMVGFGKAGFLTYSETYSNNVTYPALLDYSRSIVYSSDNENLLELFCGLDKPRFLLYGSENSQLSYLPLLKEKGLCGEISHSSHFFVQTNPVDFFKSISNFLKENICN